MTNFTKWSLRYRWATLIIAFIVLALGVYGVIALQQELLPNIEFPVATVLTRLPGASTDETLNSVTVPVEDAAQASGDILNVQSVSSPGMSAVIVMADFGQSGDKLAAGLEDAVGAISLPPGAEAEVLQMNIQDLPVIEISASGDIPLVELQPIVMEQIVPRLEALDGVSAVEVVGGSEETAPAPPATAGQGVDLPESWVKAAALRGIVLEKTGDLAPEMILGIAQMAPQMLEELTPEMLLALSPAAIQALPEEYLAGLDPDVQAGLAEAAAESPDSAEPIGLPDSWQAAGAAQGVSLETTADLVPQIIQAIAQFAPEMLEELTPEMLLAMSPDAVAALHADYVETLDPELQAQLAASAATAETPVAPPATTILRTNGNPSLGISLNKTRDANTVAVVHRVEDELEELEGELSGVRFDTVFEQAGFIEESISGVVREGALGALFAIIVILIFLSFSVRSTLVVAVSIPLSVFAAFALLNWQGLTLNMMTLGGMTVAIGRVIDDSIVVLENIYRHIQRGEDRKEAVIVGTGDVNTAILASTATTVAVFLPLGLIGGIIGQFFLPFALTVTFALAASYFVAITVVPVLAYTFIRRDHLPEEKETRLQRIYTPTLKWALRHRAWTLIGAALLFVISLSLMRFIPMTFIPDVGEATVQINLNMPPGTDMATTDQVARQIEEALADLGCVCTMQTVVGGGSGMAAMLGSSAVNPTQANMSMSIEDGKDLESSLIQIREVAEGIAGADNVTVSSAGAMFGGGFSAVDVVVTADRYEDLIAVNDPIVAALEEVDGLVNVGSDLGAAAGANGMITRIDGRQAISFSAEVEGEDTMRVGAQARQAVEDLPNLPAGVEISQGFQSQMQTEGFQDMGFAMLIAIGVVYVILAFTFRSLIQPFTILFSLPLAVIGALWALFLTGRVLSISSMIGMLMLIGIVVTNAIVLIDRVQRNRKERGIGTYDALVEAGRTRLRPILMTAIAAMLALVPLALGLTEGAIIAAELATVVIGGLFSSTLLTLLVVPTVYSLLDDFGVWLTSKSGRRQQLAEPVTGD